MEERIKEWIQDADLVLVGIGKEFEKKEFQIDQAALEALNQLAKILREKNYFAVSLCTNDIARKSDLKADRIVQPCGTVAQKQCNNRCEEGLQPLSEEERVQLDRIFAEAAEETAQDPIESVAQKIHRAEFLGVCPNCGSPLVLNTVYTESYDENGYLKDWGRYTKWLQGTLNKKLCILELGVDLTYPSIIRWPFEKVAFYNQKAHFIRVNERLYHMSEEINEKGISVPVNAVEWLQGIEDRIKEF